MENLPVNNHNGQSYGYALYQAVIGAGGGTLDGKTRVRDRALVGVGVRQRGTHCDRTHRAAALFLPPSQVFVDKQFVGVLDYETQELSLPEGKVI